jgi:hypothetical protein
MSYRILSRAGLAVISAVAAIPATTAVAAQAHIAPIYSHPYGQTYGEWAADFWQVALETPASVSPIDVNDRGENCDQGDMGNVWFLFGSLAPASVERSCEIPVGTALFFPLVAVFYGAFLNDPPEQRTDAFIRQQVECAKDAASTLQFTLNGESVPGLDRFFKPSEFFYDVQLPEDNILGVTEDVVPELKLSPSVDAGFYLLLRPLPPGSYTLHWEGSSAACPFPVAQDVTYHLTITPGQRR